MQPSARAERGLPPGRGEARESTLKAVRRDDLPNSRVAGLRGSVLLLLVLVLILVLFLALGLLLGLGGFGFSLLLGGASDDLRFGGRGFSGRRGDGRNFLVGFLDDEDDRVRIVEDRDALRQRTGP